MSRLLTVCIPTYNRADLLAEALQSFGEDGLAASGVNILVCDNASPDNTRTKVEEFQKGGMPVEYYQQPKNMGFSLNVIEAARRADGEYIWYFGDDDLIAPGTLRKVLDVLGSASPQIVYLNHQGFSLKNPSWGKAPAHPEIEEVFHDGVRFFATAGLGFLSALILRREDVLEFAEKVVPPRNSAHIETAARIALTGKGPFILLGTVNVHARIDANGGGNILTDGFVHPCEIYQELVDEGLISDEFLEKWKRTNLVGGVFRSSLFYLCKDKKEKFFDAFGPLKRNFGNDSIFPWTIGLLHKTPIFLLKIPYSLLHLGVSRLRLPLFRLFNIISPKIRK